MQSKNPRPSQGGAEHDEDLLRYVLLETTAGASGNERWGAGFREEVSDPYLIAYQVVRGVC